MGPAAGHGRDPGPGGALTLAGPASAGWMWVAGPAGDAAARPPAASPHPAHRLFGYLATGPHRPLRRRLVVRCPGRDRQHRHHPAVPRRPSRPRTPGSCSPARRPVHLLRRISSVKRARLADRPSACPTSSSVSPHPVVPVSAQQGHRRPRRRVGRSRPWRWRCRWITWVVSQLVEWSHRRNRPDWPIPTPPVPAPEGPTPRNLRGRYHPEPVPVPEARPRVAQDVTHTRGRPVTRGRPFTPADHEQVRHGRTGGCTNKAEMARELGLHKRGQLDLGRYVNQYRDQPVQVSQNGDGP